MVGGCHYKTIRVSLPSGNVLRTLKGHNSQVLSVCVSPDSKHIESGSTDCTVRIWLLADGSAIRTLKGHTGYVNSVCVSPDGEHIVSGSDDRTVRVWRLADGAAMRTLKVTPSSCTLRALGEYQPRQQAHHQRLG